MTSAELLAIYRDLIGRTGADKIGDPAMYTDLARAERRVLRDIALVCPWVMYPKVGTTTLPQLVSTDQNVWTFKASDGTTTVYPYGNVQIYMKPQDVPDLQIRPDWDFIPEGSQIRLPRNRKWNSLLYWRGVVDPPAISDTENPHFFPDVVNELTALNASQRFLSRRNPVLKAQRDAEWMYEKPRTLLMLKRQYSQGGVLSVWSLKDVVTPLL